MGRNPAVGRQGPAFHQIQLPAKPAKGGLRIKQIRSSIGHADTYRRTLAALGLRRHQQVVTVQDTPSIRGMLFKVRHLVDIVPTKET